MKGENAFTIMAAWRRSAKQAGFSKEMMDARLKDAMPGDYEHLCKTLGI